VSGSGCAVDAQGPDDTANEKATKQTTPPESVRAISEALSVTATASGPEFHDASNKVFVRVFVCPWEAASAAPWQICSLPSSAADYIASGGGAEVAGNSGAGGLLTASVPTTSYRGWYARSKDHIVSYPHQLRAYIIGMRIAGVSGATLLANVQQEYAESAVAESPFVTSTVNQPNRVVIGGGGYTNYSGAGLLLIESLPEVNGWSATGQDHGVVDTGTVVAVATHLPSTLPGLAGTLSSTFFDSWFTPTASGYFIAVQQSPDINWAITSIGGWATRAVAGRFITDMFPDKFLTINPTVTTKDHVWPDVNSTHTLVSSVGIRVF
jgi:hypothetical protein